MRPGYLFTMIVTAQLALRVFPASAADSHLFTATSDGFLESNTDWVLDRAKYVSTAEDIFMIAGVSAADIDGDGWPDLLLTVPPGGPRLFRNDHGRRFVEITESAGLVVDRTSSGSLISDLDNDGDQDILVTFRNAQSELLFVNGGEAHFRVETIRDRNLIDEFKDYDGYSVCAGDMDRDGLLDLYTCEWGNFRGRASDRLQGLLYRNESRAGELKFRDITESAGLRQVIQKPKFHPSAVHGVFSFSAAFSDLDHDGWPDLVIAGDFGTSMLFWNNRDGSFLEATDISGVGLDENGMGLAIGDYDNDADLDFYISSIYDANRTCETVECNWVGGGNKLYRNEGSRQFVETAADNNVVEGGWGWGTLFFDYDNDGDLDLVSSEGINFPYLEDYPVSFDPSRNRLWENVGGTFKPLTEWADLPPVSSRGVAVLDYDHDGDLDLVFANSGSQPLILTNHVENDNRSLRVFLRGTRSNRDGIGAKLTLRNRGAGWKQQFRELRGGSHYLGHSERIIHFGVGEARESDLSLTIEWPSGSRTEVATLVLGEVMTMVEPDLESVTDESEAQGVSLTLRGAIPGKTYRVQSTVSLVAPVNWDDENTVVVADEEGRIVKDVVVSAGADVARFFRVIPEVD